MKNQAPTEPIQPMWLHRESTGPFSTGRDGRTKCTVMHELVWGHVENVNGRGVVRGDAHYSLSGPTAKSSIVSLAEQYNATRKLPPDKLPKVVADGGRLPKDGGVNQQRFALTLQPRLA